LAANKIGRKAKLTAENENLFFLGKDPHASGGGDVRRAEVRLKPTGLTK
jgi:hypothetical protein